MREVEEETGLRVRIKSLVAIDSIHDTSGEQDFHGLRIIYRAEVVGGSLRHEACGSTDCCAWHELDAVPNLPLVDLAMGGLRLLRDSAEST
jgi:ADP-ribose pyrophosphatase YjhB (NUDIX family)